MNALMFSRSPIPYHRDKNVTPVYYEHVGVYAFRKQAPPNFSSWPMTPLEAAEKIECLRYLENSIPLKMVVTVYGHRDRYAGRPAAGCRADLTPSR